GARFRRRCAREHLDARVSRKVSRCLRLPDSTELTLVDRMMLEIEVVASGVDDGRGNEEDARCDDEPGTHLDGLSHGGILHRAARLCSGRLTGGGSAASEEAKPTNESATPGC